MGDLLSDWLTRYSSQQAAQNRAEGGMTEAKINRNQWSYLLEDLETGWRLQWRVRQEKLRGMIEIVSRKQSLVPFKTEICV